MQVLEFVRFKERLGQSHTRAVAYCERAVLALTSPPDIPDSAAAQVCAACYHLCQTAWTQHSVEYMTCMGSSNGACARVSIFTIMCLSQRPPVPSAIGVGGPNCQY